MQLTSSLWQNTTGRVTSCISRPPRDSWYNFSWSQLLARLDSSCCCLCQARCGQLVFGTGELCTLLSCKRARFSTDRGGSGLERADSVSAKAEARDADSYQEQGLNGCGGGRSVMQSRAPALRDRHHPIGFPSAIPSAQQSLQPLPRARQ